VPIESWLLNVTGGKWVDVQVTILLADRVHSR
jgi:hypothetical protein